MNFFTLYFDKYVKLYIVYFVYLNNIFNYICVFLRLLISIKKTYIIKRKFVKMFISL